MKNKKKRTAILFFCAAVFSFLVYYGSRQFESGLTHFCIATPFDDVIPVLPWTIIIYFGAYLFWGVNFCLAISRDKKGGVRFLVSFFIGETVCFLVFLMFPTTMDRPDITGTSLFDALLRFTYRMDKADNLLPSIHCFASWLCWIGVRNNDEIAHWYQKVSLLTAIAICISTLTVKQHVIVDVAAGILLAELCFHIAGREKLFYALRQHNRYSDG